jgi:hypothetical protein
VRLDRIATAHTFAIGELLLLSYHRLDGDSGDALSRVDC